MSVWVNDIESLTGDLNENIDNLNLYADNANSAITQSVWESNKSKYDTEKNLYDSNLLAYGVTLEGLERFTTATRAVSFVVDIPNKKDKNQWLAGGYFRNATYAGGMLWSPIEKPSYDNRVGGNKYSNLLNGNILSFLGYGFGNIRNLLQGGQLNLNFDDDVRETSVYSITIEVINPRTNQLIYSNDSEFNGNDIAGIESKLGSYNLSLREFQDIWGGKYNMQTAINSMMSVKDLPAFSKAMMGLQITMKVMDVIDGKDINISQTIQQGMVGTVYETFAGLALSKVANAFGLEFTNMGQLMAYQTIGLNIISELVEMNVEVHGHQYDNHFGFGGELMGFDANGNPVRTPEIGMLQGVAETALNSVDGIVSAIASLFGVTPTYGEFGFYQTSEEQARLEYSALEGARISPVWGQDTTISWDSSIGYSFDPDWENAIMEADIYGGGADLYDIDINPAFDKGISREGYSTGGYNEGYANEIGRLTGGIGVNGIGVSKTLSDTFARSNTGNPTSNSKIVCTAMNKEYGFGSFRNKIWLAYARKNLTPHHERGYHLIFKPLVKLAYEDNHLWLRKILEHIARHRSVDLRAEMNGHKRDNIGRIERAILEPICYIVGKLYKN